MAHEHQPIRHLGLFRAIWIAHSRHSLLQTSHSPRKDDAKILRKVSLYINNRPPVTGYLSGPQTIVAPLIAVTER